MTDLIPSARPNDMMAQYFSVFCQTRLAVGASQVPRGALIETDATLIVE
jgi:hypothetical protein